MLWTRNVFIYNNVILSLEIIYTVNRLCFHLSASFKTLICKMRKVKLNIELRSKSVRVISEDKLVCFISKIFKHQTWTMYIYRVTIPVEVFAQQRAMSSRGSVAALNTLNQIYDSVKARSSYTGCKHRQILWMRWS